MEKTHVDTSPKVEFAVFVKVIPSAKLLLVVSPFSICQLTPSVCGEKDNELFMKATEDLE